MIISKGLITAAFVALLSIVTKGQSTLVQVGPDYLSTVLDIHFAPNGTILLSSFGGIYSSASGAPWQKVNTAFNGRQVREGHFTESSNGRLYVWDAQVIYYTSDHGVTWEDLLVFSASKPFPRITSIASQGDSLFVGMRPGLGYLVANDGLIESFPGFNDKNIVRVEVVGNSILVIDSESKVYVSSDHGKTWSNQPDLPFVQTNASLRLFGRKDKKLVVANGGSVWVSLDFGKTWSAKTTGLLELQNFPISSIEVDGEDIFLTNYVNVYKSTFDLSDWDRLEGVDPYRATPAAFAKGDHVIAGNEILLESKDKGLTWAEMPLHGITDNYFTSFTTMSDGSVLANGPTGTFRKRKADRQFSKFISIYKQMIVEGDVVYTGGPTITTWSLSTLNPIANSPIIPNIVTGWSSADEVQHVKDDFFVSLAERGVWKFTSEDTWQDFNTGLPSLFTSQLKAADTLLYALANNTTLYQSKTSSPEWKPISVGSESPVTVYAVKDSIVVTGTSVANECRLSTDYGSTWKRIGGSTLDIGITYFHFDAKDLLVTTYNSLFITRDMGETWTKVPLIDSLKYSSLFQSVFTTEDSVWVGTNRNGTIAFPKTLLYKVNQGITFESISDKTFGDSPFSLTATSSSLLPVQFTTTSDKVTLQGNQVTLVKPGRAVIKATQPGNGSFHPATPLTQSFCIKPVKPTVSATGLNTENVVLTSTSQTGNQWYKDGEPLPNAVSNTLTTSESGVYSVKVTVDDCSSEFSNEQVLVVTGDDSFSSQKSELIYPNPASNKINISLSSFTRDEPVSVVIYNSMGTLIHSVVTEAEELPISLDEYQAGLHVVQASQRGKTIYGKFIKE